MILGMHGLFYTPEAEAARAFFRDKPGFRHVDAGQGWLIEDAGFGMVTTFAVPVQVMLYEPRHAQP